MPEEVNIRIATDIRLHTPRQPGSKTEIHLCHAMVLGDSRTPWLPVTLTPDQARALIAGLQKALAQLAEIGQA
jgi:hypothetical protein